MQGPESVVGAVGAVGTEWSTGESADGEVNLWADTVGTAARQLGAIVALAIAVHLAASLVLGK